MYEHWNNLFMITTMTIIELWVSVLKECYKVQRNHGKKRQRIAEAA